MHSILIDSWKARPLEVYWRDARAVCAMADPPCSFREALSVYRQMRMGVLFFRCTFD